MMSNEKVLAYFNGDAMAANAWKDKYQMQDPSRPHEVVEETPREMHKRLAKEFAKVEYNYKSIEINNFSEETVNNIQSLSKFGRNLYYKRVAQTVEQIEEEFFNYFDKFSQIVPQGSVMTNLGNPYMFGSLSNCFVVQAPYDSYGGIMRTSEELVQLMKRRGGVGTHLNNIRPTMAHVSNASRSSTGVPTYAERFSNDTREVAQEGRRGALMLLLSVKHPDIFRFITMKDDRSKVTGANVSVMFTDEFMEAVEKGKDFLCTFPTTFDEQDLIAWEQYEYNNLYQEVNSHTGEKVYLMKVRAQEIFEEFVNMAHGNAEPGAAYIDRIQDYGPDGVYEQYRPTKCNPCGEIWMSDYDACRLIALNFFGVVVNPFTEKAHINFEKLYEIAYIQQRLGDNLVELEGEYIQRIIDKILSDPEPMDIKETELNLWIKVRNKCLEGRRTGNGFTALGDMLAALLKPYFSVDIIEEVMKTKMRAELDATIDMAILRGPFVGWDNDLEYQHYQASGPSFRGKNSFFQMILEEFPEQATRMMEYGRRNVSWSTVAPTGTVSLMTQTSGGVEPAFKIVYFRKRKINANQTGVRVDEVDQNGDSWQHYAILHPKFAEWLTKVISKDSGVAPVIEDLTREQIEYWIKKSPWYGSQAEEIPWEHRVEVNSAVQKYTSNSISCTVNLPKDVSKEVVHNIYMEGWKAGLKGITIYREGSRTGVMVSEIKQVLVDEFGYLDAPERPEALEADYFFLKHGGTEFGVFIGKLNNNPYEVFAIENPSFKENARGVVLKAGSGEYDFFSSKSEYAQLGIHKAAQEIRKTCRYVSGMLRHRMQPKYICEQIDKAEVTIVDFSKAIQRVLKNYIPDENTNESCSKCEEGKIVFQEGCKKCDSCGYSKC